MSIQRLSQIENVEKLYKQFKGEILTAGAIDGVPAICDDYIKQMDKLFELSPDEMTVPYHYNLQEK